MNFLSIIEIETLRKRHRTERDGKSRDRIKAVLLANDGWTYLMIAEALLIDDQTISRHVQEYKERQKLNLNSGGSRSQLDHKQAETLIAHIKQTLYVHVKEVCYYVLQTFGVTYTVSGLTSWLKSKGFVYKKPKGRPYKADSEKQAQFIAYYDTLMNTTPEDEPILFSDSAHPTQAAKLTYGWIFKGEDHVIPTTGQKTRMNITAALNLETAQVVHQNYDKISGESFVEFLQKLQLAYPDSPKIHLIVDRGSCHTSKVVKEFLAGENVRIKLHYLPPYSPNLNPIERLWKIMHERVSNNKHYPKAQEFIDAVNMFLNTTIPEIKDVILNRCTDNFQRLYTSF
jgi:transposase